jgi:hypothetical protein
MIPQALKPRGNFIGPAALTYWPPNRISVR